MLGDTTAAAEAFKALGDPIRWSIIQQIAEQDELAASVLDDTLPVSKPTISYHTKILTQAGLIEVRKRGRNYFYRLRAGTLEELLEQLGALVPGPRSVDRPTPARRRARKPAPARTEGLRMASGDDNPPPVSLLTW